MNFKFWLLIIRTLHVYVSQDVRICGYV